MTKVKHWKLLSIPKDPEEGEATWQQSDTPSHYVLPMLL